MIEKNNIVSAVEIEQYLFSQLLKRGYASNTEEIEELADIFFEYLAEKGVIEVQ